MEIIMNVVTFQCGRKKAEEILDAVKNDDFGYGGIDFKNVDQKTSERLLEEYKISFATAWGSPVDLIREISKKFPNVAIGVEWAAESVEFGAGGYECKDGEILSEYYPETEKEQSEFSDRVWAEGYSAGVGMELKQ